MFATNGVSALRCDADLVRDSKYNSPARNNNNNNNNENSSSRKHAFVYYYYCCCRYCCRRFVLFCFRNERYTAV